MSDSDLNFRLKHLEETVDVLGELHHINHRGVQRWGPLWFWATWLRWRVTKVQAWWAFRDPQAFPWRYLKRRR